MYKCCMARIARVVMPGIPHHITQRGNRRMETFFCNKDYREYLDLMADECNAHGVEVWAYCLMPNHVHLIVVPQSEDGLRRAIGEAHRRYTRMVNFREEWRGHLWQSRFGSFPMDEEYLLAAARYVELNPVKAGLAAKPQSYRWSSARAHLSGKDDVLVKAAPILERVPDWRGFLAAGDAWNYGGAYERHERTGRPLGGAAFIRLLEKALGRMLRPRKPGRKPRKHR